MQYLLVLALILAPLATELPEKANSILWSRRGKDALALGNITGALVFQSMIPVAVGLAFTPWSLSTPSLSAVGCALVGGAVALYAVLRHRRFSLPAMVFWARALRRLRRLRRLLRLTPSVAVAHP
jgi:cation:H+ antiporter